jgi:hypothetical protein
MQPFFDLSSAFGLSGAAGLNAYIPLLTIAIMQNRHVITLAKPYDVMGQWWVIAILVVLLIIELVVDKVPGLDHINDVIHTAIRPSAGALVFAAQMGHVSWVHPSVWIVLGLLMSGGVHAGKALARPVVNVGTAGIGAPIVSTIENVVSVTLSVIAIVVPILAVILLVVFGWVLIKLFWRFFGGWRRDDRVRNSPPITVPATPVGAVPPARESSRWGGGI